MALALEVKSLRKSYGKIEAVKGIDFVVAPNEIFALIGPNGAGKSTTLRIIATILTSTSGEARVYGLDVQKQAEAVRQIISYLPEEAGAYKNLTGLGYLKFMAALYSNETANQRAYLEFAKDIAGLGPRLRDKIRTYSKGMTRKLLLARTVMTRPKLAILDEPTSGLDVINALEIRKTVRRLAQEGMAVLLSSHNMLEIEFLSDRLGIINQGQIIETGTARELKAKYKAANLEEVFMNVAQK